MSFNTGEDKFATYAEYKNFFVDGLIKDLKEICPEINENDPMSKMFTDAYKKTGQGFIFIIDEWDYIFSDKSYRDSDKMNFLAFLTDLLKDKSYVEFAYMTGILPIAKYFSTSFCNMFPNEHNSFSDRIYGEYFGFTEKEVKKICAKQKKVTLAQLQVIFQMHTINTNS